MFILEPWVEYRSQKYFEIFAQNILQKRGKFSLLISLLLAASGCSINRPWLQRDVRKGTLSHASKVKYKAVDSGDLILSCSVSSVKIEELEVLEVESSLETVDPYQFEPLASDSSAVVTDATAHIPASSAGACVTASGVRCSLSCRHLRRSPPSRRARTHHSPL